jgi:ABC-type glycerol-3-phosphate transport system substrate-binding protein
VSIEAGRFPRPERRAAFGDHREDADLFGSFLREVRPRPARRRAPPPTGPQSPKTYSSAVASGGCGLLVVGKITLGEGDVGFVYATDAAVAGDDVTVIELPEGSQPPIEYQIAVVSGSEDKEAAEAFVDKVLGPEGQETLEAAGFVIP